MLDSRESKVTGLGRLAAKGAQPANPAQSPRLRFIQFRAHQTRTEVVRSDDEVDHPVGAGALFPADPWGFHREAASIEIIVEYVQVPFVESTAVPCGVAPVL